MVQVCTIVPVFKQPSLMIEAVEDLLSQTIVEQTHVIIAVDGCPLPSTRRIAEAYAAAHPERITVLAARTNKGLSGNRNLGVEAALQMYPELEALTFLDSDDRLHPRALEHFLTELRSEGEEERPDGRRVGWVFTDPYQFGGIHSFLRKPAPYSVLWHIYANSNSATSLIAADVFKAGCRFDEGMRRGYEDWDFWLQAVREGFAGKFIKPPTFYYRRRPESMSSSADASERQIELYVRTKNKDLHNLQFLTELEHIENPRFAYSEGGTSFQTFSDDEAPHGVLEAEALAKQIARNRSLPITRCPSCVIWGRPGALEVLRSAGSLKGALWRVQRQLRSAPAAVVLRSEKLLGGSAHLQSLREHPDTVLFAMRAEAVGQVQDLEAWDAQADVIGLPGRGDLGEESSWSLARSHLAGPLRPRESRDAFGAVPYWQPRGTPFSGVVEALVQAKDLMVNQEKSASVGFVHEAGWSLAALRRLDALAATQFPWSARRLVFAMDGQHAPQLSAGDTMLISLPRDFFGPPQAHTGRHYLGSAVSDWMMGADKEAVVGAFLAMSAVVNCGNAAFSAVAYRLGESGVRVHALVMRGDDDRWRAFCDNLIAYEHAYSSVFLENDVHRAYLEGRGFPMDKLIAVALSQATAQTAA